MLLIREKSCNEWICFCSFKEKKKWTKSSMFLLIFMVWRVHQAVIDPWQHQEYIGFKVSCISDCWGVGSVLIKIPPKIWFKPCSKPTSLSLYCTQPKNRAKLSYKMQQGRQKENLPDWDSNPGSLAHWNAIWSTHFFYSLWCLIAKCGLCSDCEQLKNCVAIAGTVKSN